MKACSVPSWGPGISVCDSVRMILAPSVPAVASAWSICPALSWWITSPALGLVLAAGFGPGSVRFEAVRAPGFGLMSARFWGWFRRPWSPFGRLDPAPWEPGFGGWISARRPPVWLAPAPARPAAGRPDPGAAEPRARYWPPWPAAATARRPLPPGPGFHAHLLIEVPPNAGCTYRTGDALSAGRPCGRRGARSRRRSGRSRPRWSRWRRGRSRSRRP